MSLEFMETAVSSETFALQAGFEVENKTARHVRAIGSRAIEFEGFLVLEAALSPYEELREQLASKIIDQSAAIEAIIESIERSGVRVPGDNRPIANLAFLGPTGVGKSETAKTLCNLLGEGEGNLVKIDCSNFSHGYEVASLTGAPPAYVGREQTPRLDKALVESPGTVILFDEIEKGAPQLYNLMLQIMGDGELQLNNGDTVSFRDTIVVLTSNLGAKEMAAQLSASPLGFAEATRKRDKESLERVARRSFTDFFSPEFVNRLNKTVVFHPLGEEALGKVLDVKLAQANEAYADEYGVRLSLSPATKQHLVNIALKEPHLGARPLIRALEDNVQSTFGRYNSGSGIPEGTHMRVIHRDELPESSTFANGSQLVFTVKPDRSIRKRPQPLALPAAQHVEIEPDIDTDDEGYGEPEE